MQLDLELYRESVEVEPSVRISFIDVAPERPLHTLVFIHGFGGRARQWRYQMEQFGRENRVIAIDLRGHGRSSRPRAGYDMKRMLADVTAVLDHLQLRQPFVMVGHSFGVAFATEFAWRYPQRVSHLILIAGAGEYDIPGYFKLLFRLPPPVIRFLEPVAEKSVGASMRSLRRTFLDNVRHWRGWEMFPELRMPTMVIMGNKDRVLPQEAFERVGELVPQDSEVINVGVSAHMVMLERRDAVNRAIERFIEDGATTAGYSRWRTAESEDGRGGLLAERPWLASYESDVPPTIDIPRLPLTRLLDRAWRRFPRRPALIYQGRTLTYRNLSAQAARLANALRALGCGKGTRVMLLLPNVPQAVIAFYGVLRLGAVVVMGNPLAEKEEIVREAQRSGAEVLITLTRFQDTAVAVKAQSSIRHVIYANVKEYLPWWKAGLFSLRQEQKQGHRLRQPLPSTDFIWRKLLRQQATTPPEVNVKAEDTAVIQFTSGTTAEPKGIMLSHHNLVANTMQIRAWLPDARDGEEVFLCVVPFSHVYGMTTAMNVPISLGASMVLLPTFNVEEVLQNIKRYKPTLFPGVPAMYVAINEFRGVRKYNVQSIRACISGAAPLPIEVKEAFEKLTKGKLVEGYGLSEASPVTHANPINGRNKVGSIGLPLPGTEARIISLKSGTPLKPGQVGELVVRGPQVMQGYWQDETASRAVIDKKGWLHTNDIARMDEDGYFQIISRRQDMWTADDEAPAFPRDVEEVIYELPEVREVVVVAIANQPIAFVSLKEKTRVPAKAIIAFCQRRLPSSQVPKLVIFVKEFPRSFIGKVLRRELVSQYAHEITAEAGSVGEHLAGLED
ncbi:MAG: alpha/beta fold hydrolase [Ardenticatenaceae bacterium]|nr:alpha/beta fold hydrolase [Ardenticatenaceae bacterium]